MSDLKFKATVNGKEIISNGFLKHKDGTVIVIVSQNDETFITSPIDKGTELIVLKPCHNSKEDN